MRSRAILLPSLFLLAVPGCRPPPASLAERPRASVIVGEPEPWRAVASTVGEDTIDRLDVAWTEALEEARQRFRRKLSIDGPLLVPGGGLARAAPAPGPYRCRVVRLGAGQAGAAAYAAGREGFCFVGVEGDRLSLTSEVRGARIGGNIWETERSDRLVFLGASIPAGAQVAPAYGDVPAGDVAGVVERLGEFRYRLVVRIPGSAQKLAVFDLRAAPRD